MASGHGPGQSADACTDRVQHMLLSLGSESSLPSQHQTESRDSHSSHQQQLPLAMQSAPTFLALNDTKAGMGGLDTERINQIILEASKDSAFFKRQADKQKVLNKQIADLLGRKSKLTKEQIRCAVAQMDSKASGLELQRTDFSRIIVHMDMDMFYAAVEMRDNPALANVPLAVGSNAMISTSNYEARKFGVRAGMAGFIGRKLCPELVIIPVDMKKYQSVSEECMSVVAEYDPEFRSASVDEVYFDLTQLILQKYNDSIAEDPIRRPLTARCHPYPQCVWDMAADVVSEIRNRIKEKTKLSASAGIAHNKMLAKVCSDINKPDGQFLLSSSCLQTVEEFVSQLKVRKIGGIGHVQEQHLKALGIETCGQLFEARGLIQLLFKPAHIDWYLRVSLGVSSNDVRDGDDSKRKSLGSETTFRATSDLVVLNKHLNELSAAVSEELQQNAFMGKTITLIIKWSDFISNDRSKSFTFFTSDEKLISETVNSLLEKAMSEKPGSAIRLLGVRVSNFGRNDRHTAHDSSSSPPPQPLKKTKRTKTQKSITDFVEKSPKKEKFEVHSEGVVRPFSVSSRLHPDHDFVCVYCLKQFRSESSLEHHLDGKACPALLPPPPPHQQSFPASTSSGPSDFTTGSIECPNCVNSFPGLHELNRHLDQCLSL